MKTFFTLLALLFFASISFAVVPDVASLYYPDGVWSNAAAINVKVTYSGQTDLSYIVDQVADTIPDTVSDSTSQTLSLGGRNDGIYYFHVRAKNGDGWSDTRHYKLMVDKQSPTRPENVSATAQADGTVSLKWDSATDALSGIESYNIYRSTLRFVADSASGFSREFTIRDTVAKKIASNVTGTTFNDTNFTLGEGFNFHYRIQTVDNAGNTAVSTIKSVKTTAFCDLSVAIERVVVDGNLSITVTSSTEFKKGAITVTAPDGTSSKAAENIHDVTEFNAQYPLAGKQNGEYVLDFTATDLDGEECEFSDTYYYDTTNPVVSIISPQTTQELSGAVHFEFLAKDDGVNASGVESVNLYVIKAGAEQLLGAAQLSESNYSFDWNSLNFENGRFKFIAKISDNAGNSGQNEVTFTVKNTFFESVAAESAILAAGVAKEGVVELFESFRAKNISPPDLNIFAPGDMEISDANRLFREGLYFAQAKVAAEKAKAEYEKISNLYSSSTYTTKNFVFNENQTDVYLSATGLPDAIKQESSQLIKRYNPSRRLEILFVNEGNVSYYKANIVVSISNIDSNSAKFRVVEFIPKRFADDASDLSSPENFTILQKDPVVTFESRDINFGDTYTVVYGLSQKLTKEQADALVSSNLLEFYTSPPVLVGEDADLSKISKSAGFSLPDLGGNSTLLIVGAIIVVLFILFVIAAIAAAAIYFLVLKKKHR